MPIDARPLALLAILAVGCSEELGPERFPTAKVRGSVAIGDRRLTSGFVAIDPFGGTRGNVRVAPIHSDGRFEADGVAVGRVIVRIEQIPDLTVPTLPGPLGGRRVESLVNRESPIRRTIPSGGGDLPIDLIDEANRALRTLRKSRRRRNKPARKTGDTPRPSMERDDRPSPSPGLSVPQVRIAYRESTGPIHLNYPVEQLGQALGDEGGTVWIDIQDLESANNDGVDAMLRETFQFHPLAVEDALKDTHVPKIDDWGKYLYIVVDTIDFNPETDELILQELDLFLGKNYLVSYHNEVVEVLERHRRNLEREPENRLQSGPSHLLYRLLDDVVAEFLPAIEHLDDGIDDAQDEVFDVPTPNTLRKIFHVKRNGLKLHRTILPMREVLNRLARDPYAQIEADNRIYFRDVYDHLVRIHDIIESLRDLIAGALDTYLSVVSNRTNEIMKALTIVNVMFLPLTFVVGFFGMNFFGENLVFATPLPRQLIFWGACGLMVASPVGMVLMARRRGWF